MTERLPLLSFLLGSFSIVAQTILARELLVLFHGSELSLAIVLGSWMLLAGLGSWAAGRRASAASPRATLSAAVAAAVALPAAVVASRTATIWLPAVPGAIPGGIPAALSVPGILAVAALPCGAWFALAAALPRTTAGPGRAYAWEASGGLAGGALHAFVIAGRLDGLAAAAALSAGILAVTSRLLARPAAPARPSRGAACAALAAAALLPAAVQLLDAPRRTQAARWPGLELLDARDSRQGNLALLRAGGQTTLFSSGSPLFSFPDPEAAEAAAHLPLLAAPAAERVLIAGGGAGGLLGEVLKHSVREVDYLELDPLVVALARPHLPPEQAAALEDPRVTLRHADLRAWLAANRGRYDAILLGAPEPVTASANRYATRECFDLARRSLRDGGVVALSLPSAPNYLGPDLRLRNGSVFAALRAVFPRVEALQPDPLVLLASASSRPLADPERLVERFRALRITARTLSPEVIRALLAPERAARTLRELAGSGAETNTDLAPVAYLHHARHRGRLAGTRATRWLPAETGGARWAVFLLPALGLAAAALVPARTRTAGRAALALAAAATGCAAMVLHYLLLFVYQTSRGMLYGRIGLLSGLFMGGLAAGSSLALRRAARGARAQGLLLRAEAGLLVLPAAAAGGLFAAIAAGAAARAATADLLTALVALGCGFAAGFEFPLFALAEPGSQGGAGTGRYYALDLLGGAAGALLAGLWLLPLLGLWWALAFTASLKAASLLAAALAFRRSHP